MMTMPMPSERVFPDFRSLFECAPGSLVVLAPDLRIIAATDAFLKATMTRREDILGRELFEVFPTNPEDPAAQHVVERLRASFERVLRRRAAETLPVHRYDLQADAGRGPRFEERYWSPITAPAVGPDGQLYIIYSAEDVTEFVHQKLRGAGLDQVRLDELSADTGDGLRDPRVTSLAELTRRHVLEVYREHCENVTRTARALGISRVALRDKLRKYGLERRAAAARRRA